MNQEITLENQPRGSVRVLLQRILMERSDWVSGDHRIGRTLMKNRISPAQARTDANTTSTLIRRDRSMSALDVIGGTVTNILTFAGSKAWTSASDRTAPFRSAKPIVDPKESRIATSTAAPISGSRFGSKGLSGVLAGSRTVKLSDCCFFSRSSDMPAESLLSSND